MTLPEGESPAARYRVEAVNDEGEAEALRVAGQDARSVTAEMPAARLKRGLYALKLYAVAKDDTINQVGSFYFNVE